jgi:hypothetical protein
MEPVNYHIGMLLSGAGKYALSKYLNMDMLMVSFLYFSIKSYCRMFIAVDNRDIF